MALPFLFEFWAMEHQLPPAGDWRSWVIMGGRGAGKTRAGAEWVRSQVEGPRPGDCGPARCDALVGETLDQAREVMVFGDSGILACSPLDRRPRWHASRKRLIWPNGAVAQVFSARDPESLRGPQFDAAWVDELAKWKSGRNANIYKYSSISRRGFWSKKSKCFRCFHLNIKYRFYCKITAFSISTS